MKPAVDPRVNIRHQIKAGQVYADKRTEDELQLVYIDNQHALLKDEDEQHARLVRLQDFERAVGAGRYNVSDEIEVNADTLYTAINFTEIDGVGETTARALQANGYITTEDIRRADRDELLAVRGVGNGNLSNIEAHVERIEGQDIQ